MHFTNFLWFRTFQLNDPSLINSIVLTTESGRSKKINRTVSRSDLNWTVEILYWTACENGWSKIHYLNGRNTDSF